MRTHTQSLTGKALGWPSAMLAAALLLLTPSAPATAKGGPEKVTHQGSSSSRPSAKGSGRSSSAGRSSSRGKTGSISSHSSGGSRGSSASSSSGSVRGSSGGGKIESIRQHQPGGGGSSGGGSSSGYGSGYSGHHHGNYYYGGYHPHRYYDFYLGFGYSYPSYYWYWPFLYPYYPYYPRGPRYVVTDFEIQGALDLNVKPKDTQVYVDGRFIGTTGEFDGVPRYLWLSTGTYELIFYKPGYQTVMREYEIHPDLVIKEKFRMTAGESIEPKKLSQRLEEPAARPPQPKIEVERAWQRPPTSAPTAPSAGSEPSAVDARQQPATVYLTVQPADASIYLDGRFVGVGNELPSGLLVDPGAHRVEIIHPQFQTRELSFEAKAQENVQFDVRLDPKGTEG